MAQQMISSFKAFSNWILSSMYRVLAAVLLLSLLVLALALTLGPLAAGLAVLVILLETGSLVYHLKNREVPLDTPEIDRLFQQVPCYLSIQDRHLRIIRTNEAFRRDFGDRIGEKCFMVYKNNDTPCPNCPVLKTLADGQTHSTEESVITKDGKPGRMIVYTAPVEDKRRNIVGVMEMSTNITEIKELQEQIDAGRQQYRSLFERVPCYISVQDENLRIVEANEQFKAEFGDHLGECCYKVYKDREEVCPDCPVQKTFADGKVYSREETVVRPDGTKAQMLVYSSPIYNEKGERVAVMEMSTDVSEVKRLQRELTHMGETVALMAHRIKNILMGLEGGIFVVNTGMEGKNEDMTQRGWGMIERNVELVSRIVKDLLYCSKQREMNFAEIDPSPIVRSVYELFKDRTAKEQVDLELQLDEPLPVGRFDQDALHSLITNLVTNALDACRNDATDGKDQHRIIIRATFDDVGKHVFEVTDNGPGIPGPVGERLFEDFFSTKGREGTGLGLLVSHRIVEEHGGSIAFHSNPDRGTTFRAVFPLQKETTAS